MMQCGEDVSLDLMDRALDAQDEVFACGDLHRWFAEFAPDVDPLWVEGRITGDTVNDPDRRHIPEPRDLMFLRQDGRLERYDPRRHGEWTARGPKEEPLTVLEGEGRGRIHIRHSDVSERGLT
jgi:hypothetical protein